MFPARAGVDVRAQADQLLTQRLYGGAQVRAIRIALVIYLCLG
jgi:hypothetical protein